METIFTRIYLGNLWLGNESRSGTGSDLRQTEVLRAELPAIFKRFGIKTLLDIPCGDFNWMRHVDLSGCEYIGGDIVETVIASNQMAHQGSNLQFRKLDLTVDSLPQADLILCRDCLVHLSYADAFAGLRNMAASGSTYLLMTTFTGRATNTDIETGGWRVLNLEKPPFSLPAPALLINENCTENDGIYADKSLGLWRLDEIGSFLNN